MFAWMDRAMRRFPFDWERETGRERMKKNKKADL
jgi:hypothetical protein